MKPKKVNSIGHLKQILSARNGEPREFFILLNFGLRSSKLISWDGEMFYVLNESDDSEQELTEAQLMDEACTNIGKAIANGAFYLED